MRPEDFVAVTVALVNRLEPPQLGTVLGALAPLIVKRAPARRPRRASPKPPAKAAKAKPRPANPNTATGRVHALLEADPTLSIKALAEQAHCSQGLAQAVRKRFKGEPVQRSTNDGPRASRPSERAQALLRQQLANGPKRGEQIEAAAAAAEIPERSLIAACSALGVVTKNGEWRLPG